MSRLRRLPWYVAIPLCGMLYGALAFGLELLMVQITPGFTTTSLASSVGITAAIAYVCGALTHSGH